MWKGSRVRCVGWGGSHGKKRVWLLFFLPSDTGIYIFAVIFTGLTDNT